MIALGIVIVGNPQGQPPSGWPVSEGCVTQGFNTGVPDTSHQNLDAVDIAPREAGIPGQPIYATHDGIALVYDQPLSVLGKHVVVVSPLGFKSYYGHFLSFTIDQGSHVAPGDELGRMGNTGDSTNVHVHYHLEGAGYKTSDYIPDSGFDGCVDRVDNGGNCDCCFNGRQARCGE